MYHCATVRSSAAADAVKVIVRSSARRNAIVVHENRDKSQRKKKRITPRVRDEFVEKKRRLCPTTVVADEINHDAARPLERDERTKKKGPRKVCSAAAQRITKPIASSRDIYCTDDGEVDLKVARRRLLEVDATSVDARVVQLDRLEGQGSRLSARVEVSPWTHHVVVREVERLAESPASHVEAAIIQESTVGYYIPIYVLQPWITRGWSFFMDDRVYALESSISAELRSCAAERGDI